MFTARQSPWRCLKREDRSGLTYVSEGSSASKMSSCARVQDGSTSNQPFEFNASVDPCRRIHPECNFILNCKLSEVLRMSNYILAGFK